MKQYRKFSKLFQIRWKEPMGLPESPYLYRWTLVFFGLSIRLHHWIKSDDNRYFHDHSCNLISIVLKGYYYNVKPTKEDSTPYIADYIGEKHMASDLPRNSVEFRNELYWYVEGLFNSWSNFFHPNKSIWHSKATNRHWLCIPEAGAWTILLCGRPYNKWGFYHPNAKTGELVKWRPLRYFHKYGIIQTKDYQ
jgi:hypothetical protein